MGHTGRILTIVAILAAVALGQADDQVKPESRSKPPYERLLVGDDAKRAAEWAERMAKAQVDDDYSGALELANEILELRVGVQVPITMNQSIRSIRSWR